MLRIVTIAARQAQKDVERIALTGQVAGRWVAELERICRQALDSGHDLEIDMREVTFLDHAGLELFRQLLGARVTLVHCALFVAEQLRTLEQDAI